MTNTETTMFEKPDQPQERNVNPTDKVREGLFKTPQPAGKPEEKQKDKSNG